MLDHEMEIYSESSKNPSKIIKEGKKVSNEPQQICEAGDSQIWTEDHRGRRHTRWAQSP